MAKVYDHEAVGLCAWCGDEIEQDADGEFRHLNEARVAYSASPYDPAPAAVSEEGKILSYRDMLTELEAGRGVVVQGVYSGLKHAYDPTPAEAAFIEVFLPDA